jgi:hypothetical protein
MGMWNGILDALSRDSSTGGREDSDDDDHDGYDGNGEASY